MTKLTIPTATYRTKVTYFACGSNQFWTNISGFAIPYYNAQAAFTLTPVRIRVLMQVNHRIETHTS